MNLKKISARWNRETRNRLNIAINNIKSAVSYSEKANINAKKSFDHSLEAKRVSRKTQKQLDNIVLDDGDSEAEVVQARGDYDLLSKRLDEIQFHNKNDLVNTPDFEYQFSIDPKKWDIDFSEEDFDARAYQGMALTDDYMYVAVVQPQPAKKTLIVEIDRSNLKLKRHLFVNAYHANSLCYCEDYKDKEVLIANHMTDKSPYIEIIDLDTFSDHETKKLNERVHGISYDPDEEIFITTSPDTRVIYDKDFEEIERYDKPRLGTSQGSTLYKGLNIFPTYKHTGILVEDYKGNTIINFDFPLDVIGEIEQMQPVGDGDFLAIVNTKYDNPIKFYKVSLVKDENNFTKMSEYQTRFSLAASPKYQQIYVDKDNDGIGDGSKDTPFGTISDALNVMNPYLNTTLNIESGSYDEQLTVENFFGEFHINADGVTMGPIEMNNVFGVVYINDGVIFKGVKDTGMEHKSTAKFQHVRSVEIGGHVTFDGNGEDDEARAIRAYDTNLYVSNSGKVTIKGGYEKGIEGMDMTTIGISGEQDVTSNDKNLHVSGLSKAYLTFDAGNSLSYEANSGSIVFDHKDFEREN